MRIARRVIALVLLLGWLFATGHVVLEHGGVSNRGVVHDSEAGHGDDGDHGDGPSKDGDDHHHDLSVLDGSSWVKSAEEKTLTPVWFALSDEIAATFAELLHQGSTGDVFRTFGHAPPDQRAYGWILICQTVHQVRGPSRVV